jgi:hypothetical protein
MNFNHYPRMTNNLPTSQMYKETHTSVSILYKEWKWTHASVTPTS